MLNTEDVSSGGLRDWHTLDKDEQTQYLVEYGHYLDSLPPTCDIDTKNQRFQRWLGQQGINYTI